MTYTITNRDLYAHKASVRNNNIFKIITAIRSNVLIDNTIVISFDETVQFIDPLFFILLFDLHSEYESLLVLDIRYIKDNNQHYVHRLLTQYSDLEDFEIYSPYTSHIKNKDREKNIIDIYDTIYNIAKEDKIFREERIKEKLARQFKTIHLFTSVAHRKSLINDSEYEYSLLPILKLRNFELKDINTTDHEEALEPYSARRLFYNKLSLDQTPKEYRDNLRNKIDELLVAVGLGSRGLSSSFRDIFSELIDNIRKHTPAKSNAHISFRKNIPINQYELIVSDNSDKGFISTYRETLTKEKKRLEKSGVKKELLKNYIDVIQDIEEKNYKKILTGLFQIQKNSTKDSKEDMHIHQIPRIAMHFGLPLLVKLLEKISQQKSKTTPELKLFLHNQDKYFEITYKFKDGKSTLHINDNPKHRKTGTYIIITFPEDVKIDTNSNSDSKNLTSIDRDNDEYNIFIDKRDDIEKQIEKISFYLDTNIEKDLDASSQNIYVPKEKSLFIKYTGKCTFSEFIRNIYLYAYKYDIEDIVVFNVPLFHNQDNSENIEHLRLLESIMYGNPKVQYEKSLNILFYSDREPEAILIGGRNQKEYCYLNQLLPVWYETRNKNSICTDTSESSVQLLLSNLFIELGEKTYLLPFELFEISDEDRRNNIEKEKDKVSILEGMLEKYLNEVAKIDGIHIDTGTGYHIDRFMEFKKVFEDSRWVKRLAFRLAMQFPKKPKSKKYYLYGTDKYTNMLISLCYSFLNLDFDRFRYKLFNIHDSFDYKVLREKIQTLQKEMTHEIFLVSSVVVNAQKDIELINDFKIEAIPAIQLDIGGEPHPSIKPLVSIKNDGDIEKINYKINEKKIEGEYCKKCSGKGVEPRKVPLLEFTENDPFFIKDTFFDTIQRKNIRSYSNIKNIRVKWFDSLNFGHVERGNNHFLYYINTIKFFNQNRDEIEDFLSKHVAKSINYNKQEKIVLLTSSHDTNNNFVALANQKIFNNEAIVLSFNKSRGEANFHDLDSYKFFDWTNTRVFFVDDSIASSHTIKYFYQMLRSIPGIMDNPNVGLDGVIIMIDRISSYDETILCSYLRDSDHLIKPNKEVQQEKLKAVYAFATYDIKPIKSEVEECFLCKRNKKYIKLAQKSALDLTTFQMIKRAYKLRNIEYRAIQPAKIKTLVDRFKTYLKAMATIHIYQEFANKSSDEFGTFDNVLQEFSNKIYMDLITDKKERFEKYDQNTLKSIIKFQSEIALIKALSSPRLSYYYEIRRWLIPVILDKLKKEVNKIIKKDFSLVYKLKDTIENCNRNNFEKKDIQFLDFYEKMTNLHLINVYFATLSYFEDSKILDTDYIQFFYKITQSSDVRDFEGDSLLHTYPFAVKFTIADNLEKAIYFEQNINTILYRNKIRNFDRRKKYSYINALKIENTLFWKSFIHSKIDITQRLKELSKEKQQDIKIEIIKDIFISIFGNSKVYLFISPYATVVPVSYQSYLDNSEKSLINILDSYKSINSYDKNMFDIVQKVFYGAVDKQVDTEGSIDLQKVDRKDVIEKISDTWANDYDDKYCVVRLTNINETTIENYNKEKQNNITDNDPVWFRPIGCIVVENSSMNYPLHMDISRTILSIKNYITSYIEREFSYGAIQEAIQNKEYQKFYDKFIHIDSKLFELSGDFKKIKTEYQEKILSDAKEGFIKMCNNMEDYAFAVAKIARIGQLSEAINRGKIDVEGKDYSIKKLIEEEVGRIEIATSIIAEKTEGKFSKVMINHNELNDFNVPMDTGILTAILYEMVYNACKYGDRINDYVELKFISINNGIQVINRTQQNQDSNTELGIKSIQNIFEKIEYIVTKPIINNGHYVMTIKGKRT